jgi:hypothetical protein
MTRELSSVLSALARVQEGGEISVDEVQNLKWEADAQIDLFVRRIYRELHMFASDHDIRGKDIRYDRMWRAGLFRLYEELKQLIEPDETRCKTKPLTPYQSAQLFSILVKRKIVVEPRQLPDNSVAFSATDMKVVADAIAAEWHERENDPNRKPTQWDGGLEELSRLVNNNEPDVP